MRADLNVKERNLQRAKHLLLIGVTRISLRSFTKLVGIGSESDDWHGPNRTGRCTSSSVTQVRLCKTFLVSAGFNTLEHKAEDKEERMMEIFFMKKDLNLLASASIEE